MTRGFASFVVRGSGAKASAGEFGLGGAGPAISCFGWLPSSWAKLEEAKLPSSLNRVGSSQCLNLAASSNLLFAIFTWKCSLRSFAPFVLFGALLRFVHVRLRAHLRVFASDRV